MEITGRIIERGETQVISERFSKREIVIETAGNEQGEYKQSIPIEFINKAIEKLDGFPVGCHVTVTIEIRGRAWQKEGMAKPKYFVSINGWRIEKSNAGGDSYPLPNQGSGSGGGGSPPSSPDDDDIPFSPNFYV